MADEVDRTSARKEAANRNQKEDGVRTTPLADAKRVAEKDPAKTYVATIWRYAMKFVEEAQGDLGRALRAGDETSSSGSDSAPMATRIPDPSRFLAEVAKNRHLLPAYYLGSSAEYVPGFAVSRGAADDSLISLDARLMKQRTRIFAARSSDELLHLLGEDIASTLERAGNDLTAPRDRQIDLLVHALRRLPTHWIGSLAGLLPDAAGYLLHGREIQSLVPDELSTLAALGDLVHGDAELDLGDGSLFGPYVAAQYYHRVVAACVRAASAEREFSERHRSILGINLNNVVAETERILRRRGVSWSELDALRTAERKLLHIGGLFGSDRTEIARSAQALETALEPLMRVLTPSDSSATLLDPVAVADAIFPLASASAVMQPEGARSETEVEMTQCVPTLITALVSSVLAKEHVVGSRYFNAGVCLLHLGRTIDHATARAALNAMGLWWALRVGRDVVNALTSGDGADCAVNLLGSAAELPRQKQQELRPALQGLLDALCTWSEEGGPLASPAMDENMGRMAGSAERLSLRLQPESRPSLASEALEEPLRAIFIMLLGSHPPTPLDEAANWSGQAVGKLIEKIFPQEARDASYRHINALAKEARDAAGNPVEALTAIYTPALEEHGGIENGLLLAYLPDHVHGRIQEDWARAWKLCIRPCEDLGAAVRHTVTKFATPGG